MNEEPSQTTTAASPIEEAAHLPAADGFRKLVLEKLRRAGADGLTIRDFGCSTRKKRALLEAMLADLIAEGRVACVEEGRQAVCFLAHFAPTAVSVRRKVEQTAREAQASLLARKDLIASLNPAERPLFTRALVGLLAEKTLVKVSHFGRTRNGAQKETDYYLHATGLRELVAQTFPDAAAPTFTPPKLLEAYRQLVRRHGFPDVEIFELNEVLGLPSPEVRTQILSEYESGRAVLSFGDWSLASPETRSAAIEINGDRYLRVRFQDENHVDE